MTLSKRLYPIIGIGCGAYGVYVIATKWHWRFSLLTYFYGGLGLTIFYLNNQYQKRIQCSEIKQPTPFDTFVQNHYNAMKELLLDEDKMNTSYQNSDEDYLSTLKQKENHYTSDLPFEYNSSLIMFYHDKEECFHYYTKCGDVTYPVLNTICRGYVIEKKCLQLFKDEGDLTSMKKDDDIVEVPSESEEEEEEKEETKSSVFYLKRFNQKKKKQKKNKDKVINKFIRKGNVEDYDVDYRTAPLKQYAPKPMDYLSFKAITEAAAAQQILEAESDAPSDAESESESETEM